MESMAKQRQAKIERFKQQKEMERNLHELYTQVQKEHVDEDVKVSGGFSRVGYSITKYHNIMKFFLSDR